MRAYLNTLAAYRELKRLIKEKGKKDEIVNGWTFKNMTYSEQSEASAIMFCRDSGTEKKNKCYEIIKVLGAIYCIIDGRTSSVKSRTLRNFYELLTD